MKKIISESKLMTKLYIVVGTVVYTFLSLIIPTNDKLILFSSFSGRQFSDSPRKIYESLIEDDRFNDYRLVWVLNNPTKYSNLDVVKNGSLAYYLTLFRAKYWIANTSIERLIPVKGKKHVYINTWHGIPFKKLGVDQGNLKLVVLNWYNKAKFDLLFSCSQYDRDIFKRIFPSAKKIINVDLPRNNYKEITDKEKHRLQVKYGIDPKKKTILYAPTFRDYSTAFISNKVIQTLLTLSQNYNILVREHYFSSFNLPKSIRNVSNINELEELMDVSDLLISDYSSIIFDYALQHKPIYLYMYDRDTYEEVRGFYLKPTDLGLPFATNGNDLVNLIKNIETYDMDVIEKICKTYHSENQSIQITKIKILSGGKSYV